MNVDDQAKIDQHRHEIDRIDQEILRLLNQRAEHVTGIGGIKHKNGSPITVPEREKQIMDALAAANRGPLSQAQVEAIYGEIIRNMKVLEQR